jgi:hypothetical protein
MEADMKTINRSKVFTTFLLIAFLLSACAGAPATASAPNVGGSKPLEHPVTYVGMIESIAGDEWTINGLTITVDPAVVRDGPFGVGDQVKVEGVVNQDGSVTVSRVEMPSQADLSTLPQLGNDNEANANDANSNDDNVNDANSNDDNGNDANSNDDNVNDDNGNDANSNDDNGNDSDSTNGNSNDDDANSNDDDGDNSNTGSGSNSNDDDDDDDDDDNGNDDDSDDDDSNDD